MTRVNENQGSLFTTPNDYNDLCLLPLELILSDQTISNGEAKWIVKNKKLIFWLFFICFSYSKGKAKPEAKMPFLFHKSYSYISLKRVKTNKVGLTKK